MPSTRGQLPSPEEPLVRDLEEYADAIAAKFRASAPGEPEDQLRSPIEGLFQAFGKRLSKTLVLKGESRLADRLGRPDFAVHDSRLLIGYIEVKAPGKGADPRAYRGRDLDQWRRFKALPNLIYTDGTAWTLFRSGERVGAPIRLGGDLIGNGAAAIAPGDANALSLLLANFVSWSPIVPHKPKELAEYLAPICRLIRTEVEDSLERKSSPLNPLMQEITELLFPGASSKQFADAYAQTVIFALLLARLEGADTVDLDSTNKALASHHLLLARCLQHLTEPDVASEVEASLAIAQRVIAAVDPDSMKSRQGPSGIQMDPWLFFYEHFLAKYDPKLRREWGVYYTPIEVVQCQVSLVAEVLRKHLGKELGYVEPGVITLDPALGTGTYLLAVLDHALRSVERHEGPGAVKGGARGLASALHGFEWMVGPYAVAQLRLARALGAYGVSVPPTGPGVYLTNTLEAPHQQTRVPALFQRPLAAEHARALKIKDGEHVLICLGNPPYGRNQAADPENAAVTGGWVRYGDPGATRTLMEDFAEPVRKAGAGRHLKNLYNLYVYFVRWAMWKLFEHASAPGPGILCFITASSYLDGDAFIGVRTQLRRLCDQVDIIDLGGDSRGTNREENVFSIKTPVAIMLAWRRDRKRDDAAPANVRYARIVGTRREKLEALQAIAEGGALQWQACPSSPGAPFRPEAAGDDLYQQGVPLDRIFPWRHSGAQFKRTWPVAPDIETLVRRWRTLVAGDPDRRAVLFGKASRDRSIDRSFPPLRSGHSTVPIASVTEDDMVPPERYAYRSFDRQWSLPDNRIGDFLRPDLWGIAGERQVFLTTLCKHPLGAGPAMVASADVPDLHHFRGSVGGADVFPLYRDAQHTRGNVNVGLLTCLREHLQTSIAPEDLAAYVYAVIAHSGFTATFRGRFDAFPVRVPVTCDKSLFDQAVAIGRRLLWLHTFGARFGGPENPIGRIPSGRARCIVAVPDGQENYPRSFHFAESTQTLYVGSGEFAPVAAEIMVYEVSGLPVVASWLSRRMQGGSGKQPSELNEIGPVSWSQQFTRELLEILWVLEASIDSEVQQKSLLERILAGPRLSPKEVPTPPKEATRGPAVRLGKQAHDRLPGM